MTDAVGTRTFAYRASDLQLDTESINPSGGGLYTTKLITRKYQTGGVPGRSSGFQVGTTADPDADYDVTYNFSTSKFALRRRSGVRS